MKESDKIYYGIYAAPLENTMNTLVTGLSSILDAISTDPEARPAEHILYRIKGAESLKEKMRKKGESEDPDRALEVLSDVIGVRIVVHFPGDVYEILGRIRDCANWQVVQVKDYIAKPKPNGYRSLHVILEVPFTAPGFSSLKVEVQLRTIAQDCWASLEHQLRYKKTIDNPALIEAELARCAAQMASTDVTMETIRQMIQKG